MLQTVNAPRLIFAGGSNVRYGINSKMIKDSLQVNPINTAVSAGVGLKFILDDLKPYLKPNEIVVLSPEYDHFYGKYVWGNEQIAQAVNICPEDIRTLNYNQLKVLAGALPHFNVKKLVESLKISAGLKNKLNVPSYESMTGLNQFGDTYSHWGMTALPYPPEVLTGSYNEDAVKVITAFNDYVVKTLKGKLFLTMPPFAKKDYLRNSEKIAYVNEKLAETNIPQLGKMEDFILDDSLFFNSAYHLNRQGDSLRTRKLIDDYRLYLKGKR